MFLLLSYIQDIQYQDAKQRYELSTTINYHDDHRYYLTDSRRCKQESLLWGWMPASGRLDAQPLKRAWQKSKHFIIITTKKNKKNKHFITISIKINKVFQKSIKLDSSLDLTKKFKWKQNPKSVTILEASVWKAGKILKGLWKKYLNQSWWGIWNTAINKQHQTS